MRNYIYFLELKTHSHLMIKLLTLVYLVDSGVLKALLFFLFPLLSNASRTNGVKVRSLLLWFISKLINVCLWLYLLFVLLLYRFYLHLH